MPNGQWDLAGRLTLRGLASVGPGFRVLGGELLVRLWPLDEEPSGLKVVPYVGGGVVRVSYDYPWLEEATTWTGFVGSGGVLLPFLSSQHWRPYAEVTYIHYDLGSLPKPTIRGLGFTIGCHYYF